MLSVLWRCLGFRLKSQIELRTIPENPLLVAAKLLIENKFAEIAAKEPYRAKSIKGNVYNWNTANQFMQQD